MTTARHDDEDGSEIFWPGYVDATTNLILNLLFLLTILIVAVFMFALELGRSTQVEAAKEEVEIAGKPAVNLAQKSDFTQELVPVLGGESDEKLEADPESQYLQRVQVVQETDPVQENIALKREIERLNTLLAQRESQYKQGGGVVKTVDATINVPKPSTGLDKALASEAEVLVRFKNDAIEFTPEERLELLVSLQPMVANGEATIYVEVPAGFSEAKRLGYYRAMAVRNLLIELEMPGEKIDVSVFEGETNANASLVKVR